MGQNLRELNYLLQPMKTRLLAHRKDIWQIKRTEPLPEQWIKNPASDVLYYAESESPMDKAALFSGINLLIFSSGTAIRSVNRLDCPEINLLLAPREDSESILNTLTGVLTLSGNSFDLYRELLLAVNRDTLSDGSFINKLSLLVGNPVAVFESLGKPIEIHEDFSIPLDFFRDALSAEAIRSFGGILEIEDGRRLFSVPVSLRGNYTVFFVMEEQNIVLDAGDMDLLSACSEAVRAQLQKNNYMLASDAASSEEFLLRLISGEVISPRYIDKLSLIFGVSRLLDNNGNYIAAVRIPGTLRERPALTVRFIMRDLQDILHAALCTIRGDHIVLLFSGQPQEPFSETTGLALNTYLVENSILAGVSIGFSGLSNISMYYDQAVNAATLFERIKIEKNYILIQDYMFFDLIMAISGKKRLHSYISDKVRLLIDYDEKYGTDNIETLRHLLKNTCNIKRTAEHMFIHRNTLLYRVKRMEEISGIDFSDDEDIFYTKMSLKVLDFLSRPLRKDDKYD